MRTVDERKITFGEMREMGVRCAGLCDDYRCRLHIEINADQWPDGQACFPFAA